MKLRIRENTIRFRLTKSEVAEFGKNGLVENQTDFGNGQTFIYALKATDSALNLKANFADGRIEILVPKVVAQKWTKSEEVGISGETGSLQILIEKDFACLTIRENEDESDAFPHPKEKEMTC